MGKGLGVEGGSGEGGEVPQWGLVPPLYPSWFWCASSGTFGYPKDTHQPSNDTQSTRSTSCP